MIGSAERMGQGLDPRCCVDRHWQFWTLNLHCLRMLALLLTRPGMASPCASAPGRCLHNQSNFQECCLLTETRITDCCGLQAEAGDLDSQPCLQLLGALLSGPGVGGLRALALGRCLHAALALSPIASDLFMRATSDTGMQTS